MPFFLLLTCHLLFLVLSVIACDFHFYSPPDRKGLLDFMLESAFAMLLHHAPTSRTRFVLKFLFDSFGTDMNLEEKCGRPPFFYLSGYSCLNPAWGILSGELAQVPSVGRTTPSAAKGAALLFWRRNPVSTSRPFPRGWVSL